MCDANAIISHGAAGLLNVQGKGGVHAADKFHVTVGLLREGKNVAFAFAFVLALYIAFTCALAFALVL